MTRAWLLLASMLAPLAVRGVTCLDNPVWQQNLPAEIGKPDGGSQPFALQCDTVFVRKGVTTTVRAGAHLYFAKPSLNSVIKVEGTLLLKGTKAAYVTLSGSADSGKPGPGDKPWGGIEVAEGGKLSMEFTGVAQAPTPITAFSRQVRIVNSFFKGSSGMILPDGSLMPMDPKWQAINDLDLSRAGENGEAGTAKAEGLTKEEKAVLLEKRGAPFWTWKKAAAGAAAAALAVGAGLYLLPGDDGEGGSAPEKKSTIDPEPPLPP